MKKIYFIIYALLLTLNVNIVFSQLLPLQIQQKERTKSIIEHENESELEQNEYEICVGLLFGYGLNFHHTDFRELPKYPSCCNTFKNGFGQGINLGALVQFRMNENLYLGSQLLISNLNSVMKHNNNEMIAQLGVLQNAVIENKIDASINTVVISPFAGYSINKISENFQVIGALNLGFITKANFTQYEELKSPLIGTFENGLRIRNNITAELPEKNILFGVGVGAQYDFPLNNMNNWRITPEFRYNFWLTSPVRALSWYTSQINFGISIRYNKMPSRLLPTEPLLPPLPPMRLPKIENNFIVDVNHSIPILNPDGTYSETDGIIVEEYTQTNLKPLLNYIFFDTMSAEIPSRYKRIDTNEMMLNEYRNFSNMNSLETYYLLLDIIGFRLKKYPNATIELVGTNSGAGGERNNLKLSERRANSVKKYLMDIWKINSDRIKTTARNLPKEPTRPTEINGDEENRRVEIYSDDGRVTESILSFDTISIIKTPYIKFIPSIISPFGVTNANLNVNYGTALCDTSLDANFSPVGMEITNEIISRDTRTPFTYQLTATDKMRQQVQSDVKKINVNRVTIESKKSGNIADTSYDYYSLILFEFNSTNLGDRNNKVIDYIKTRIKPNSKIIISGYTDIIGLPEANKKLATERAIISAKRLGIENVELRGIGTDELLYDNDYPEGRFYCRTVTIQIVTPIYND